VYAGVSLRLLVPGSASAGSFSQHQVRLAPSAIIGLHHHADQWEGHLVLGGSGRCLMAACEQDYRPGTVAVMPVGVDHQVQAGADGLELLATFAPPLV
jgi:quercetin dioxygenase-like cupin family protein